MPAQNLKVSVKRETLAQPQKIVSQTQKFSASKKLSCKPDKNVNKQIAASVKASNLYSSVKKKNHSPVDMIGARRQQHIGK